MDPWHCSAEQSKAPRVTRVILDYRHVEDRNVLPPPTDEGELPGGARATYREWPL